MRTDAPTERGMHDGTERRPAPRLLNVAAFLVFAGLWLLVGVALVFNGDALERVWDGLRGLPWVLQALAWLLLLPVVAGLWIWHTDWSLWLRVLLVAGLGIANIVAFYPWRPHAEQTTERPT